jgi:hypothetical protein
MAAGTWLLGSLVGIASNAGRNNFPLSVRDATGSDEEFVA